MPYAAPLAEMRFVIDTVAPLGGAVAPDLADAILEEAGKFAAAELEPLNRPADRIGSGRHGGRRAGRRRHARRPDVRRLHARRRVV